MCGNNSLNEWPKRLCGCSCCARPQCQVVCPAVRYRPLLSPGRSTLASLCLSVVSLFSLSVYLCRVFFSLHESKFTHGPFLQVRLLSLVLLQVSLLSLGSFFPLYILVPRTSTPIFITLSSHLRDISFSVWTLLGRSGPLPLQPNFFLCPVFIISSF